MAITIEPLDDGQLPNAKTALFTATVATIIKSVVLTNTGAGANLVNLYFKRNGGTSRRIIPKDTSLSTGDTLSWGGDVEVVVLDAGGVIEGSATNAAEVDYVISGVQRT